MTQLKCSVETCMYNDEHLCAKGDIMVGGQSATTPNETCCESFRERSGAASNMAASGDRDIQVKCKAEKCIFNEECRCSAKEIGIAGSSACKCAETECASFRCE